MPSNTPNPFQESTLRDFLRCENKLHQWPELIECHLDKEDHKATLKLNVHPDLEYFAGHFPDQPVLPGVVQIHWAGEFTQQLFGLTNFGTLQGAKFNSMVLPSTEVTLDLVFKPEKNSVRFAFYSGSEKYSLGTLIFGETSSEQSKN